MFLLEIHPATKTLRWVRGGHDPAILHDASKDTFSELPGEGMALGVNKNFQFQEVTPEGWTPGSVIRVDFGFWIADCGFQKKKTEILLWERLLAAIS